MSDDPSRLQEALARVFAPGSGASGPAGSASTADSNAVANAAAVLQQCLPDLLAAARAVDLGALEPWRSWRRLALADGGWIRALPMDRAARHFFVQAAGPWADLTPLAGMHHVRADALLPCITAMLQAIRTAGARSTGGELADALHALGLALPPGASHYRLVDATLPTVGIELGRGAVVTVMKGGEGCEGAGLRLKLQIGPDAWAGECFEAAEVGAALSAIRTAVAARMQLDQKIQDDPARAERLLRRLLVSDQDLREGAKVLWLSPGTRDFITTDGSRQAITLPAMTLLDVFANRFHPLPTLMHGLRLAHSEGAPERAYGVAIVTPRGPWIARLSLRAMAEVIT